MALLGDDGVEGEGGRGIDKEFWIRLLSVWYIDLNRNYQFNFKTKFSTQRA